MACHFTSETSGFLRGEAGSDKTAALLDKIHYTYKVFNNGTVTLTNFTVSDAIVGGTVCSIPSLAPSETFMCYDNTYIVSIL